MILSGEVDGEVRSSSIVEITEECEVGPVSAGSTMLGRYWILLGWASTCTVSSLVPLSRGHLRIF
jgi:hypothetical protein